MVCLPTEWEWQWVAQAGAAGLRFPWGPDWLKCGENSRESGIGRTTAVGLFPAGQVQEKEVFDLAGNVRMVPGSKRYSSRRRTRRVLCVLRGGAWNIGPGGCRAAYRFDPTPDLRDDGVGFRVCRGSPIDPWDAASLGAESLSR